MYSGKQQHSLPTQVPASDRAAIRGGGPTSNAGAARASVPGSRRETTARGARETYTLPRLFYQVSETNVCYSELLLNKTC